MYAWMFVHTEDDYVDIIVRIRLEELENLLRQQTEETNSEVSRFRAPKYLDACKNKQIEESVIEMYTFRAPIMPI